MCRLLAVLVVCSSVFLGGTTSWAGDQGKGPKNKAAKHAQKAKVKKDRSDRPDQHGAGSQMRFNGLDMNNDGRISRAEWRGNDVSFGNHDWNRDGVLSGDEVRPGATRPAHPAGPAGPASHVRFDSLDLNNNGVIVPAEWRAGHRIFDRLDTNDDGRVTPAEFARWQ